MSLESSGGRRHVQGALEDIVTKFNGFQNCADVVKTLTTDAVLRTLEELDMVRRTSAHMMDLATEVAKERATSAAAAAAAAACAATRAANDVPTWPSTVTLSDRGTPAPVSMSSNCRTTQSCTTASCADP